MSVGHIQLGNPGALRPYLLHNFREYQAATANPFAARINTSEEWGSLEDISEWVMDDWQAGQGQKDAEAGGNLYSLLDTMVPNQLTLPPMCIPIIDIGLAEKGYASAAAHPYFTTINVGEKLAFRFTVTNDTPFRVRSFVYAQSEASAFSGAVYTDADGEVGEPVAGGGTSYGRSKTASSSNKLLFAWWGSTSGKQLATGTYWMVFSHSIGAWNAYPITFMGVPSGTARKWNAEEEKWETSPYAPRFFTHMRDATAYPSFPQYLIRASATKLYVSTAGMSTTFPAVHTGNEIAKLKTKVTGLPANKTPTTLANVGDYIYVGYGDEANAFSIKIADDSVADLGYKIWESLIYNGYFWRSVGSKLYYTTNLTTWYPSEGIDTGDASVPIVSIAGAGGTVYMATKRALYMAAPGDFPVQLLTFTQGNDHTYLHGHGDSLYIIAEKQLFLMDASGQVTEIWNSRHHDIAGLNCGTPIAMTTTRNILFVLSSYQPTTEGGNAYISAWVHGGWHHVASHPISAAQFPTPLYKHFLGDIIFDNKDSALYVTGFPNVIWKILTPPDATNTWYEASDIDSGYEVESVGWIEFPKFYGGPRALIKDWHSVAIFGDNLNAAGNSIEVLWKNKEYSTWQSLGVINDSNAQFDGTYGELFWDINTLLPVSNDIQLALHVTSVSETNPLRINSIRLQYKANVADRWRWPLTIEVSDDQQMLDGKLNSYTAAQMRTRLNGLITQDKRFIFEDIDGTQYEVVAEAARWNVQELEYFNNAKKTKWLLSLTLLQPTDGTYTPPEEPPPEEPEA